MFTTLTVLILHNVESVYFFYSNPVYCPGDEIEKNEMGWACGAYWGEERHMQGFGGEI